MAGTHIHLDPVGGVAGDMFAASLLHAFPEHAAAVTTAVASVTGIECRAFAHGDRVLTGMRFDVPERHDHGRDGHHHAAWRDIRDRIAAAPLSAGVKGRATGIFSHLAAAEAQVHGIAPDDVAFHEVGALDSIADIVAAAVLIDALGASWSVGPLPLGGGLVRTAHGMLPVPAPATALLLTGFEMTDDGVGGERVTPTGAAILRHLACRTRAGLSGRLVRTGLGFGTRTLPGRSNVLRALVFETAGAAQASHRELAVVAFEVDDQSGEDLATGLDRLRALPFVHDVTQSPVMGKKGRIAMQIQLLARPDALDDAIAACFRETTTIGLRTHLVHGHALPRRLHAVDVDGATVRVKTVERPEGPTHKAESDDVAPSHGHAARARLRRLAEAAADV